MQPPCRFIGAVLLAAAALCRGAAPVVTYAGNAAAGEFHDVLQLSDGSVLVAGGAEDLDWISAPKHLLDPLGIPARSTGRTGFVMRLAGDLGSILGAWHFPPGHVAGIRWLKTTSKPGAPTGAVYLSGACDDGSGDWFIARLDGNFVEAPPTGFAWTITTRTTGTHGDNLGLQAWDVGGDGHVAFANETGGALRVFFVDAHGDPLMLPALRGSHWPAGVPLDDANRLAGIGADLPAAVLSAVSFPADLRSWTDDDRLAVLPDGHGQIKRGRWPLDLFVPVQDKDGGTTGEIRYGYTGYRSVGQHRLGGIAIDRDRGDFFLGFNIQSRFWDHAANIEQPDFEPAVIGYAADGSLNWWSRLYHEVVDANGNGTIDPGETRLSSPDQYVDGLAVDHSTTPPRLVVNARCHGNNESNLWRGNRVAAAPDARGFQNSFTGTEGNIHLSWLGKLRGDDATLLHATYLAGYFRDTVLSQATYPEPIHDGWPSHNHGWPNLTTTRAEPGSLRCDAAGRSYLVGRGPRMVTTSNAWQKLPKITPSLNEGISPWAAFVRVLDAELRNLVYSSALTGCWTYPSPGAQPVGADNTILAGVFPTDGGVLVAGSHRATNGTAEGNPVPVSKVPPWGAAAPANTSAIFARLPFDGAISQHFNNGSGSAGDTDASLCGWSAAFGNDTATDATLATGDGAATGVSQGRTDDAGVPLLEGRTTQGGFLFSAPNGMPGAILLHTVDAGATTAFQDPQSAWLQLGHEAVAGMPAGRIAALSAYTRPATAGVPIRFALRIDGSWFASSTLFTQPDPNRWEFHTLVPAGEDWIEGLWPAGMPVDDDLLDNPRSVLDPNGIVSGYGIWFHTGSLAGNEARARLDSFEAFHGPHRSELESWRFRHFLTWLPHGSAADAADPDFDGLTNFTEFAFARNPLASEPDPPLRLRPAEELFELTFHRARTDVSYVVQGSPDLDRWHDLATNPGTPGQIVGFPIEPGPCRFFRVALALM